MTNKADKYMKTWVVDIKGDYKNGEISVIRNGNFHGIESWGWFGKDKLCIYAYSSYINFPEIIEFVWNKLVDIAHEIARELNDKEKLL